MLACSAWRKPVGFLVAALSLTTAASTATATAAKPARAEIPISRVVMPDGVVRYTVDVKVGSFGPFPALLDTGSTGLLVLTNAMPAQRFPKVGSFYMTFASGEKMTGAISLGTLNIGGLETGGPIRFGAVQSVDCAAFRPKCAAAIVKPADYGIAGDAIAGAGFKAILGIGLDRNLFPNPLTGTGASTWIVKLPNSGTPSGALILNPTAADLEGFKRYPISRESYHLMGAFRASLPGCLTAPDSGLNLCGQVALDTGSPGVFAQVADLPAIASSHTPQRYALSLFDGAGKLEIPIEETWKTKRLVFFQRDVRAASVAINGGVMPYLSYLIFYDFRNNLVGMKPR